MGQIITYQKRIDPITSEPILDPNGEEIMDIISILDTPDEPPPPDPIIELQKANDDLNIQLEDTNNKLEKALNLIAQIQKKLNII
jgi:hypothetical protein